MAFRVLIADDSPGMRLVIRRVIQMSGFAVDLYVEAADGAQALSALGRQEVDVVLTDINMPNMNGEQFIVALRADPKLKTLPVVVVSTDATRHRIARMLELGAQGYITKPFQPETLREELERVIGAAHV
jgi:two-component system chemotaxis response regulator CheY